jgi:MFS family permease
LSARPYQVLRHRDFRLLWIAQLVSLVGTQMQSTALHWHVYLLARSPLALGVIGLTRVVPVVLLSLWGGVLADRLDRRKVLLVTQSVMLVASGLLALLTFFGSPSLLLLYGLNAVLACATAFDNPARQALVPRLVPVAELPAALSLNLTMFQTAMIAGPAVAGLILAGAPTAQMPVAAISAQSLSLMSAVPRLSLIYGLNAVTFVGFILALLALHTSGAVIPEGGVHEPPLRALRAGLRFVFGTPVMVWTTALDFFATFFAGAMSLLPIVADQVLGVGAAGYGGLVAAPALGALVGALYYSTRPLPRRQGRVLLASVAGYGVVTVIYGLSRSYVLTLVALAATGLFDVLSTVIRQTLRQQLTPDALRGRMTSVNMIFFMGGPQLGELEAGVLASLFASTVVGVTVSIVSGGVLTTAIAAYVAWRAAIVRDYEAPPG